MRVSFALALTWTVLTGCSDAQSPGAGGAASPIAIADGRSGAAAEDASGREAPTAPWASSRPFRQAVGASRTYWTRQDPGYEEEIRILGFADGAFTQAGAGQTAVLYLMGLWPRCCPKVGLAVVEGGPDGRLVRNVAFEGTVQSLQAVPDLNGDGLGELALRGGFGMGGQWTESVALVAFEPEGLAEWGGTMLSDDDCAGSGQSLPTAMRVLATPGRPPTFAVEQYRRASCDASTWNRMDGPRPLTMSPSGETTYVDLDLE